MPHRSWSGVNEVPWFTPLTRRRGRSKGERWPSAVSARPGTLVGSGGTSIWARATRCSTAMPTAPAAPASARRRPERAGARVFGRRAPPQQGDGGVLGPAGLPQQRPQPLFEDTRHAIFLRARIDRGTHLTEGREVRQVALGARAVATLHGAEPEDERVHRSVPEARFGEVDLAPLQRPTV